VPPTAHSYHSVCLACALMHVESEQMNSACILRLNLFLASYLYHLWMIWFWCKTKSCVGWLCPGVPSQRLSGLEGMQQRRGAARCGHGVSTLGHSNVPSCCFTRGRVVDLLLPCWDGLVKGFLGSQSRVLGSNGQREIRKKRGKKTKRRTAKYSESHAAGKNGTS